MHRALYVPEILHQIFSTFGADEEISKSLAWTPTLAPKKYVQISMNPGTLAKAARCCTQFTSPALDVLWRVMFSMSPLLHLVSSFKLVARNRYVCTFNLTSDLLRWRYSIPEFISGTDWARDVGTVQTICTPHTTSTIYRDVIPRRAVTHPYHPAPRGPTNNPFTTHTFVPFLTNTAFVGVAKFARCPVHRQWKLGGFQL